MNYQNTITDEILKTNNFDIQNFQNNGQKIIDLLVKLVQVPVALIMKVEYPNIKVYLSANSPDNPYRPGDFEQLTGLYCERVIKTGNYLIVPNALSDSEWDKNPDIKLGMISYLGFPIYWPNMDVFGTLCILDNKENRYNPIIIEILEEFRNVLNTNLKIIYQNYLLKKMVNTIKSTTREFDQTILSQMSHEFRNPLNGIIGFTELLLAEDYGTLNENQLEMLNSIHESAKILFDSIRDMLNKLNQ